MFVGRVEGATTSQEREVAGYSISLGWSSVVTSETISNVYFETTIHIWRSYSMYMRDKNFI